jgi:acyl carrier protein
MSFLSVLRKIRLIKPIERDVRQEPTEAVVIETIALLLGPEFKGDISLDHYVVKDLGLMSGDLEDFYPMLEKTFRCKPPIGEYRAEMKVSDVVVLFEKYRSR